MSSLTKNQFCLFLHCPLFYQTFSTIQLLLIFFFSQESGFSICSTKIGWYKKLFTLDYWNINQGKVVNIDIHLIDPHNLAHSQLSQDFFHYVLIYTPTQATLGFGQLERKRKFSTPDLSSLKNSILIFI